MKRILCILLTLLLCFANEAFAIGSVEEPFYYQAERLHNDGLFNGTGTDKYGDPIFELERALSREEAVTMLVRMLGAENLATKGKWNLPFSDVSEWAKPYIGYAYANGLTTGTSATTFDGSKTVTAAQFITLMLRALGYKSGVDFKWDKAWELTDKLGITDHLVVHTYFDEDLHKYVDVVADYKNGGSGPNGLFIRGDAAALMYALLNQRVTLKNSDMTINRNILNTRTHGLPAEQSTYDGCPSFTLADTSIDALTDCMVYGLKQGYEHFYIFVQSYGIMEDISYTWLDPAKAFFNNYKPPQGAHHFSKLVYYGDGMLGIGPSGTCTFEIYTNASGQGSATPVQDISGFVPAYYDQWGRAIYIDEFGNPYYFDDLAYPFYVGTPVDEHYGEYPAHGNPVYYDEKGRAVYLHSSGLHYIIDSKGLMCFIDR